MDLSCPILIVDDDVVSRSLMEKQLRKANFQVFCAANGREALAVIDECQARIVLTDWMMPEIDGTQLCRLIRKKIDYYVFIILITARNSKTDIVSGLESGADDYLTKPIHPAELMARINTGLRILKLEQSLKTATEEIRTLSITDPLTKCFNRAYLNERLPQEITRSSRYNQPLSILITDIDHFKQVNDTHGHQAGDMVLKNFSLCIRNEIRNGIDYLVRYGGEEFLIILPETGTQGAWVIAERLRQKVENLSSQANNCTVKITDSFGGACLEHQNMVDGLDPTDHFIHHADTQLYQSKQTGRNRVNIITL